MPTWSRGFTRLAISFGATAGLTLASVIWSESWFWGRWRPEDSVGEFLITLAAYGLAVQVVRLVASRWRVAASESVAWQRIVLVGAFYGWLVEGVIVTTVVDDLPLTLAYTGLAWHALFTVSLGWWWVPRLLLSRMRNSILTLAALGAGVGAWAAFWKFEEGVETPVLDYAIFVTLTTAGYAAGLAVWWALRDRAAPGIRGSALAIVLLAALAVVHGVANPLTLIGPALVGVALLAVIHTTPHATAPVDVGPRPSMRSLARLAVIPAVATVVFALFTVPPIAVPTGWVFLIVTAPASVALFVVAWVRARRRRTRDPAIERPR